MGVGDDAGSIVNDGYQAGRLIKYSRLGLADSVRSRKDQWTAIHYKTAIEFVNISTTCITAVGQNRTFHPLWIRLIIMTVFDPKQTVTPYRYPVWMMLSEHKRPPYA